MLRRLQDRVKNWWNIWVFVVGFPLGLAFLFFFWWYLLQVWQHPVWVILVSIVFLYGAIILILSTIIAISENDLFVSSFILLLIGVIVAVLGYFYTQKTFAFSTDKLATDFYANLSTELISVVITVFAIETLRERFHWRKYQREKQREDSVPLPPAGPPPERGDHEGASNVGRQNSSVMGVTSLGSILIGFLLGIVISQNWKGVANKE